MPVRNSGLVARRQLHQAKAERARRPLDREAAWHSVADSISMRAYRSMLEPFFNSQGVLVAKGSCRDLPEVCRQEKRLVLKGFEVDFGLPSLP